MMDIVKDAYCAMDYENNQGGMYSGDEDPYRDEWENKERADMASRNSMRSGYGYSGNNGYSERSRSYNSSRMSRMSRNGMPHGVVRGRSLNYSQADATQEFIENLHDIMSIAPDDRTKESIRQMINELEAER